MQNKILITGATGFIGSHLVELLLKEGVGLNNLRLLVEPGDSLRNLPPKKFEIIWGDIKDKRAVKKAVEGVNIIYHLAAKTVFEGSTYKDFKDINVDGTQNLLDAAKGKKIQKFVFFSSISVYGLPAYSGERIKCDETWPHKPAEGYGKSKLEAERLLIKAHKSLRIPYIIVRPTTVYGPRDHQGILELYRAIYHRYFFRIGNGESKMDYVFVRDLVRGARQAELSKFTAEDFILGADKPITLNEVINAIASSIDRKVPNVYLPENIALPLSHIVKFIARALGIRPPLFPERVRIMTTDCYFNSAKAKKYISYRPSTSFKAGALITGEWLLRNKQLL